MSEYYILQGRDLIRPEKKVTKSEYLASRDADFLKDIFNRTMIKLEGAINNVLFAERDIVEIPQDIVLPILWLFSLEPESSKKGAAFQLHLLAHSRESFKNSYIPFRVGTAKILLSELRDLRKRYFDEFGGLIDELASRE